MNYQNINEKIIFLIKNHILSVSLINDAKKIFSITLSTKSLKYEDIIYNKNFNGKILIRKSNYENVYILDTDKKKLFKVFETVSKGDKILPIYIKLKDDDKI